MSFNKGLFLSMKNNWETPKKIYDELNNEFHFDFDPCPINPGFNGLEIEWGERNFVNPPYGRKIGKWVNKAIEEYLKGKTIVMLVASRTDTVWWHKLMDYAPEIRFIKGRLRFGNQNNSAPFPSAIIILK